jgi:hypothetical protein
VENTELVFDPSQLDSKISQLTSNLSQLSDVDLHERTMACAKFEQLVTLALLHHLFEVKRRKLFAARGYGSLFEYVCKALGFSESQAYERISAMKLIYRDEVAKEALESGKLTLTQAASAERFFKAEEKTNRNPVSRDHVQVILHKIQGKSKRETEKILLSHQNIEEPRIPKRLHMVSESTSELRCPINEQIRLKMEKFWNLRGRTSVSELLAFCLDFYLDHHDAAKKDRQVTKNQALIKSTTSPAKYVRNRYIPKKTRQHVLRDAGYRCEYVDAATGKHCDSRYKLQIDHIKPFALGGGSERSNLRVLCAVHNGYRAEQTFGERTFGGGS